LWSKNKFFLYHDKSFKDFYKHIHLKKGERGTVRFELDREALSYWNHDNNYVVERGEYEIQTGASSADIRQKISFTVK
jgi:beta-glucosidase